MSLPTGTVTFLFTDIEGSTKLWEQYPEAMQSALARHDALLREAIESHNGHVFKTIGDAFCAAFSTASDALNAALASQQSLQQESFEAFGSLRVRMALHTGAAEERDSDYFGPALNRIARLLSIGHGEQVLLSLPVEELVQDRLPEGCSLKNMGSHRLKDLQQPEHVFQLLSPGLPAEYPPLRSLQAFANNLPIQLTSFIGRDKEIEEVKSLLSKTRLLTLTGSGGCGKTRLTLQVAADLIEEYPDGVWLVELAPLSDPSLVPQAVASALGVREEPGRTLLQTLSDYLMQKHLLLLLDNAEHLLSACAALAQALLKSCPNLTLLTTSREALKVAGEQVYRVPSLLAPDPDKLPTEEKELAAIVSKYEAPRLFVERASLQKMDFMLTKQNASAVASLCHRLDGIPLAIELAASRVSALSVEEINARLEYRFRLLKGSSRTALPRQQTLQATIDWSYELLSEQERLLLGRLGVFAGGWTLSAAETVCSDEQIEAFDVLDLLASLVDKSLVIVEERDGKSRYRMLETIRAYGLQRLQESGQEPLWRAGHLEYFLALAEEAEPKLRGAEQAEWLWRLQEEHDNLRAALKWCQQHKERTDAGLRLAGALIGFWAIRGYWGEGREHLQTVEVGSQKTLARGKALDGAGTLAWRQGDYAGARALHEQSLAIRRELGDKTGIAGSLNNLGNVAIEQGDFTAARALYEESLAIRRELGDKTGIAGSLNNLGNVALNQGDYAMARALYEEGLAIHTELGDKQNIAGLLHNLGLVASDQGDYAGARAFHEQSLAIKRELGDRRGIAASLRNLGTVSCIQGDYAAARSLQEQSLALFRELGDKNGIATSLRYLGDVAAGLGDYALARAFHEQSLAIKRELGDRYGIATALNHLGNVAFHQGDYPTAWALNEESLVIKKELGDKPGIALSLEGMAALAAGQGQTERAVRLWAAVESLRETIGAPSPPNEKEERDHKVAEGRKSLGESVFSTAWEQGRAMPIEQVIAYALQDDLQESRGRSAE